MKSNEIEKNEPQELEDVQGRSNSLSLDEKAKISQTNSNVKLDRLKLEFKEWSLQTKFDCFSKIFLTQNVILQLTWLGLFLIFTALTAYFVSKNFLDFFSYETVSKIDIIDEKPTEFPAVTICNSNPFTTKTAQKLISNITILSFGKDIDQFTTDQVLQNFTDVYEMTNPIFDTMKQIDL